VARSSTTSAPAPGAAPLPAADAAALLRRNAADAAISRRPAVRFGNEVWTHGEYVAESCRWAQLFLRWAADRPGATDRPLHVGVLADNVPDYLFALGGAALTGSTVVGLNHTRVGEHLARDVTHTDVDVVVTERHHLPALAAVAPHGDLPPVYVSERWSDDGTDGATAVECDGVPSALDLGEALSAVPSDDPGIEPGADARWALIFTSGTSGAPKAVVCSQRRLLVTGNRLGMMMGLGPDDVGYVCMPLFHSNALMVGWAPSLVVGCSVGLARRFSASRWLDDVRRYGATYFNYTGKPLSYLVATPERPDDADNPLRIAFGNEGSPQVVEEFRRRFGVEVIDAFGSTEGAIAVDRSAPPRAGSVGVAGPSIRIVAADGAELPAARFGPDGSLLNADECVGEIVNTAGAGPFEGYYANDEATRTATRRGWYWSGDLGYLDDDRYLYFAGRTGDWLRVDGENFPAGPIDDALAAHPDVVLGVAYGVPDVHAGDQVMAALVLRDGAAFDPDGFAAWLDGESGLGPKWRPRYVRLAKVLPTTGTNKVLKRVLSTDKYRLERLGDDELWVRDRGADTYRRFTPGDEAGLRADLERAGRARFWEL